MQVINVRSQTVMGHVFVHKCLVDGCPSAITKIITFDHPRVPYIRSMFGNKLGWLSLNGQNYIGACANHYDRLHLLGHTMVNHGCITKEMIDDVSKFSRVNVSRLIENYECCSFVRQLTDILVLSEIYQEKEEKLQKFIMDCLKYYLQLMSDTPDEMEKSLLKLNGVKFNYADALDLLSSISDLSLDREHVKSFAEIFPLIYESSHENVKIIGERFLESIDKSPFVKKILQ